jgi:hypothetical protein
VAGLPAWAYVMVEALGAVRAGELVPDALCECMTGFRIVAWVNMS